MHAMGGGGVGGNEQRLSVVFPGAGWHVSWKTAPPGVRLLAGAGVVFTPLAEIAQNWSVPMSAGASAAMEPVRGWPLTLGSLDRGAQEPVFYLPDWRKHTWLSNPTLWTVAPVHLSPPTDLGTFVSFLISAGFLDGAADTYRMSTIFSIQETGILYQLLDALPFLLNRIFSRYLQVSSCCCCCCDCNCTGLPPLCGHPRYSPGSFLLGQVARKQILT